MRGLRLVALVVSVLVAAGMPAFGQTLTIALWQIPAGSIIPMDVIEAFEADHPGVIIDPIFGDSTGYEERINVMIASGAAPDLFAIPDYSITDYRERGLIQPINLAAAGFDSVDHVRSVYLPGALEAFIHDGRLWALPQEWNTLLMYYNRNILAESGVPEPDWNTFDADQFLQIAVRTTQKAADGSLVRAGFSSSWWHDQLATAEWAAHVASRGGSLFAPDGTLTLDTPAAREAYEFLQDVVQRRQIAVDQLHTLRFTDQRVAMNFTGVWVAPTYDQLGIDFGLVPWPMGPETVVPAYSHGWVISSQSQHADLAAEFIRYVLVDRAERVAQHTGLNLPLADAFYYGIYEERPEVLSFFRAASMARYFPPTRSFKDVAAGIRQMMWRAVGTGQGLVPFQQAVEAVEPVLRAILAQ